MAKSVGFYDEIKDIVKELKYIGEQLRDIPETIDNDRISEASFMIGVCREAIHIVTINLESKYLGE